MHRPEVGFCYQSKWRDLGQGTARLFAAELWYPGVALVPQGTTPSTVRAGDAAWGARAARRRALKGSITEIAVGFGGTQGRAVSWTLPQLLACGLTPRRRWSARALLLLMARRSGRCTSIRRSASSPVVIASLRCSITFPST